MGKRTIEQKRERADRGWKFIWRAITTILVPITVIMFICMVRTVIETDRSAAVISIYAETVSDVAQEVRDAVSTEIASFQSELQNILVIVGFLLTFIAVMVPLATHFAQKERLNELRKMLDEAKWMIAEHEQELCNIRRPHTLGDQGDIGTVERGDIIRLDLTKKKFYELILEGDDAFDDGLFKHAIRHYKNARNKCAEEDFNDNEGHFYYATLAFINSLMARAHSRRGEEKENLDSYRESLKYIERAICLEGIAIKLDNSKNKSSRYFYQRGVAHCELGDIDQALLDIDQAFKLIKKEKMGEREDRRKAVYYSGLAIAHSRKNNHKEAMTHVDSAIRKAPEEDKKEYIKLRDRLIGVAKRCEFSS